MIKSYLLTITVAILGSLLLINILSPANFSYGPFLIQLSTKWFSENLTQLNFPPVGKVNFVTHYLPVKLRLTLLSIDLQALETWLDEIENREKVKEDLFARAKTWLQVFILRVVGLSVLGGSLALLIWKRQVSWMSKGGIIGFLFAVLIIATVYITFNPSAFQDPQYVGMLEAAPWIVGLIENGLENLERLGEELKLVAGNLDLLFNRVGNIEAWRVIKDELVILHISDIHNNLVALNFIQEIIRRFPVDLIIDTGDISDYGTALEVELTQKISEWDLPYIFVPGNHDSPAVINKLQEFSNVIVIRGGTVNIKGLVITGIMDPAALSRDIAPVLDQTVQEYQEKLVTLVEDLGCRPDIVAVHNLLIARDLIGRVPVILHGHDHALRMEEVRGTVIVDAGTSGAAGIRGFTAKEGIPYGLALLRLGIDEKGKRKLKVVDLIKVYSREKGFIVERRIIN